MGYFATLLVPLLSKYRKLAKILHCRRQWRHWQIPTLVLNRRDSKKTPCIQSNIVFCIWPLTEWKEGLCWWKHFVRLMMDPKKKSWVFLPPTAKLRGRIVDLPVFHLFQPLKASCEGKYTDITQLCTKTRHKKILFLPPLCKLRGC